MRSFKQLLKEDIVYWEKFKHGNNYDCGGNRLTSLEGAPEKVGGNFGCHDNRLTSLEGAPQNVGGDFGCHDNRLTSLKGAPQNVGGDFYCSYNNLTSLEGAPQKVGGNFYCSYNNLTSLEGTPQKVNGDFSCYDNPIKSLKGIGKDYLKEINGFINLDHCPIESHMLGLLKVKGLTKIEFNHNNKVEEILNKHLKSRDILSCQDELIENGLEEYAKL